MNDWQAWKIYPHHRWIFNKLELSLRLGYNCGPAGVPVTESNDYIIRPIYNLNGMSINARVEHIQADTFHAIDPGQFWCEVFEGNQISIDYVWKEKELVPVHASQGFTTQNNLTEFYRWIKIDPPKIKLPEFIEDFDDVDNINIEFIGDNIIEMHLRHGADFPEGATEIIPVWKNNQEQLDNKYSDWKYISNYESCDGYLSNPRLGFYYK